MDKIDQYIAKLWEPDKYRAQDYREMDIPEIKEVIRAKRAGKRGRPPCSIEDLAFCIWIDSVLVDPQDVFKVPEPNDTDFDPKEVMKDLMNELCPGRQEEPEGQAGQMKTTSRREIQGKVKRLTKTMQTQ